MPRRSTKALRALLEAMMGDVDRNWYGLELMAAAKLASGTLYPLLHRLETDGWVEALPAEPSDRGGAPRVPYRVTRLGAISADALLAVQRQGVPRRAGASGGQTEPLTVGRRS